jgi:hypothetical protein
MVGTAQERLCPPYELITALAIYSRSQDVRPSDEMRGRQAREA